MVSDSDVLIAHCIQWSNYEGARGGLAPWKTGWPPRNAWSERVQGGI